MYHIDTFGKTIDDGSSHGWNLTTIRSEETTVHVERVLYSRKLDVEPKPATLTYLAHYGGDDGKAILSHYLATSGSSGFAHILKATLNISGQGSTPVPLRSTWATFLTIDGRNDDLSERLNAGDADVPATLHTYDVKTGLPKTVAIKLTVTFDYYFGAHDGFVGFSITMPSEATVYQERVAGLYAQAQVADVANQFFGFLLDDCRSVGVDL
eukprot:g8764.t1